MYFSPYTYILVKRISMRKHFFPFNVFFPDRYFYFSVPTLGGRGRIHSFLTLFSAHGGCQQKYLKDRSVSTLSDTHLTWTQLDRVR